MENGTDIDETDDRRYIYVRLVYGEQVLSGRLRIIGQDRQHSFLSYHRGMAERADRIAV